VAVLDLILSNLLFADFLKEFLFLVFVLSALNLGIVYRSALRFNHIRLLRAHDVVELVPFFIFLVLEAHIMVPLAAFHLNQPFCGRFALFCPLSSVLFLPEFGC
jgi:hypothetical protein